MELTRKHCVPCEGGSIPLSNEVENDLLSHAHGWEIERIFEHRIRKTFRLKTFAEAIDFVNKIAAIAETEGHHPEIRINFTKVSVELFTHAISGLSENDFIMAARINELID